METSTTPPLRPLRFPLGEDVYAYVNTRKGCAKIHIRHFTRADTDTKGTGPVVATMRGGRMDLKMFNRLCKVKKNLSEEFSRHATKLKTRSNNNNNNNKVKQKLPPPPRQRSTKKLRLNIPPLFQERTDLFSSPSKEQTYDNNNNNNNSGRCHCMSALTPKYPLLSPTKSTTTTTTTLPEESLSSPHTLCAWRRGLAEKEEGGKESGPDSLTGERISGGSAPFFA